MRRLGDYLGAWTTAGRLCLPAAFAVLLIARVTDESRVPISAGR